MSDSPKVVFSPGEDPEMESASKQARKTFGFFWREQSWEYRRIIPGLGISAVKVGFSDPPEKRSDDPDALEVEHMWLGEIQFDGKKVTGTLLNSPMSLQSVSEGDVVNFKPKRINDWMYAVHDRIYGGFTVNLMRQRMGKSERKQHDNAWGFDFGDPENVLVVPPDFLGEELPKKRGLFSMFSKPQVVTQNYAEVAKVEHPMSVNMRDSLDEALSSNPEMGKEADDDGFTFLHQLSLAGSFDGVDVALQHKCDPNQPAKNGMTPYQLAKVFGWRKVMKRLKEASAAGA